MNYRIIHANCLNWLKEQDNNSIDLVFTSPPYEDTRSYGINFNLKGQDWVDWAIPIYLECVRVCKGLVCWVVEGKTKNFRWSATPVLLMADLHKKGVKLRKPAVFYRNGIPGSGGKEWLRNDWEFLICSTKGKLPWADNTAMGHKPKYDQGGPCSNYQKRTRGKDGRIKGKKYAWPKLANPGNVIRISVGKGHMGSDYAHLNEAAFPESLPEFFIKSFCPPEGVVLDPFLGSGSTLAAALKNGRNGIGIEIRKEQCKIAGDRLSEL